MSLPFQLQQRIRFRPWSEFAEMKSFSVPRSVTYRERFQTNLNYYLGNYLALLMLALVVVCISIPSFILCLLFIIAAYYYLFMVRTTPLQLGGRTVRKNELIAAYLSVSGVLCFLFGGFTVFYAFCWTFLAIVLHASLRERSLKSRGLAFVSVFKSGMDGKTDEGEEDDAEPVDEEANIGTAKVAQELAKDQSKFRNQFRESMRAKYLRKKD